MELITSSSFAVLAESDFLMKLLSCSRRDSSSPQKAGLFGDPVIVKSVPTAYKKDAPMGRPFYMELITRFELVTSSLPRMRSTD